MDEKIERIAEAIAIGVVYDEWWHRRSEVFLNGRRYDLDCDENFCTSIFSIEVEEQDVGDMVEEVELCDEVNRRIEQYRRELEAEWDAEDETKASLRRYRDSQW